MNDKEQARRVAALILQWTGWLATIGLGTWSTVAFDQSSGHFPPQWVGLAFVFALGVAISASVARSRMRLTDTILQVFRAGQDIQKRQARSSVDEIVKTLETKEH